MRKILIGIGLLLFPLTGWAGGGGGWPAAYEVYTPGNRTDTAPPRGYQPCYLSHYGRHGSRYLLSEDEFSFMALWDTLSVKGGGLTPEGRALREGLESILAEHERMFGILTQKGSLQHRGIGSRVARRFPGIFRKPRTRIRCISSPAQRCLQSLANFSLGLCSEAPQCSFTILTGPRYYDIISARMDDSAWRRIAQRMKDSVIRTEALPLFRQDRFFKTPEYWEVSDAALVALYSGIYTVGAAATGLDSAREDWLPRFFTEAQLAVFLRAEEIYDRQVFLTSSEAGNPRIDKTAKPLLRDIVARADEALSSGDIAADFRFGHDSGLLPLIALTGLSADGPFCMAENLQMVFYKNKKGEVLVKFLFNEEEITLPALRPVKACYYAWPEVKAYFEHTLENQIKG